MDKMLWDSQLSFSWNVTFPGFYSVNGPKLKKNKMHKASNSSLWHINHSILKFPVWTETTKNISINTIQLMHFHLKISLINISLWRLQRFLSFPSNVEERNNSLLLNVRRIPDKNEGLLMTTLFFILIHL